MGPWMAPNPGWELLPNCFILSIMLTLSGCTWKWLSMCDLASLSSGLLAILLLGEVPGLG